MIGRLTGELVECSPGEALVDVGGVGYALRIPLSTFYVVSRQTEREVHLHVHTHVREDTLQLFGFATQEERSAFERLIAISGVGPRVALAILSGIGVSDLERAVEQADRERLERIPGIGRKTAERVLLELRNRIERDHGRPGGRRERGTEIPRPLPTARDGMRADAVSALLNLGYVSRAAEEAVDAALTELDEGQGLESVLKVALRTLLR